MTASLQIKNNKYYVVFHWIQDGDKKQKWKATGISADGTNKRRAERARKEMLEAFEETLLLKDADILFSDYLKKWLEETKDTISLNTYFEYRRTVYNSICPYFEKKRIKLCDLKAYHLQDFYSHKMKTDNVCANTIHHYHANISKALNYAVRTDRITNNPASRVVLPKKARHTANIFTDEELCKLLKASKGTQLEPVVLLAAWFGLRRGEIIGLKWDFINFDTQVLSIAGTMRDKGFTGSKINNMRFEPTAKTTSSMRTFPLHATAIAYLKQLKEEQDKRKTNKDYNHQWDEFVCVRDDGNIIPLEYVSRNFPKLCKQAGVRELKLHELRHTNISLLLNDGASIKELQEWAGHSSYSTTANTYSHLLADSKKRLSSAIERLTV